MAIGDKPNQNLFGTNFNPEDEEEKKARLAAQGAMMGAGVPASAFGQAPAVAPFSMEAAGQVNPMMEQQSLAVTPQVPATFLPYADDVAPPPASALSVFTPGGEVKPNVDVNAITPSPEMTSTSAVNTALNQEVAVGSPIVENDPSVMSKVGSFLFPYGLGGVNRPTPGLAQGETALEATPSVTPPAERPMAGAQEQPGAVVSPFLQSPDTPSGLGGPLLRGFEMVNDAARGPNAPMGQDATRAALGGMTLNEYLNAPAGTEGVSGLQTDPQGRMITPSAQPPADALSSFEQDSLARQQRIGGTGSFEGDSAAREARLRANERQLGETQTQRDTRIAQGRTTGGQTGGISMADQTDMAKANARGASPRDVARGNQVANALGVDLKTGQPLQATGGLTFDQQLAQNKFEFDVNKFNFEQAKEASDEATANAQSATAAKFAVRDQLRQGANVMDKAQRAGKNIGFFTTGATGALFGLVAGTEAYDQKATIETLEADAAFSALQRMRDASKTGGALGNVSERELDLLKATAGSLRVGQSEEQFRENLGQYVERYNEAMLNIYDAFVADYGEKDANEAFKVNDRQDLIPQQGDNQSTGGGTTTATASGRYSVTVL